ncbi:MAG: hypothetical protein KA076_07445, partial [Candidatus Marinimicrobia bacterium]|nr:hypothetical protein [Candidatus Neomarinimicrobiota bacterium]
YSATEWERLLSSPLGRTEATDYSHPLLIFYFPQSLSPPLSAHTIYIPTYLFPFPIRLYPCHAL